ncbi:MAG: DUF4339 domain-containing protein [Candidatus Nealsonbacteria bacterium]|nr:DUF4339 domain-containing protein [Candidatus Nealsonbacteria bacterium]
MATQWFCEISGEQHGPVSSQQLKAMADKGRLTAEDRVRQGDDGSWVPASRVKGLFPAAGSSTKVSDSDDLPTALPVGLPVGLPVAQPVSGTPQAAPQAKRSATPPPAPAPPRPARSPAATGGQPAIVAEANPRVAKITGHGSVNPADRRHKKQRQHIVVVVCLVILLIGLGGAGAWVLITKPRLPDSSSRDSEQRADSGGNDRGAASGKPVDQRKWIDASSKSGKCGGVSVKIVSVETGYPPFVPRARGVDTDKEHVMIRIALKNTNEKLKVEYQGFGRSSGTILSDDAGNKYQRISAGTAEGQVQDESMYPGDSVEDLLIFQRLVPGVGFLKLELPGTVLGGKQDLYFKIPKSMIGKDDTKLKPPADDTPGDDTPDSVPDDPDAIRIDGADIVPNPETNPPGDDADPDMAIPIPGVTGENSPSKDKPPPDETGIFGDSE